MLLNALKRLGGISHDILLISPIVIEPIQNLKIKHLGNNNPRLHTDEILIAPFHQRRHEPYRVLLFPQAASNQSAAAASIPR